MFRVILFLLVTIVFSGLIPSGTLASPLMDYSLGKTTLDIISYPNIQMKDQYYSISDSKSFTDHADGKNDNFEWGLTTGLGGNLAIQYRQFNPESKSHTFIGPTMAKFEIKSQEVNVLYKINQNISAFTGYHQTRYAYSPVAFSFAAKNKNVLQVGIIGNKQIAPKTQLYGTVGVGKDLSNFESGLSYEVAKDLELNLIYRHKKVKDLESTIDGVFSYKDTVTTKGFGLGITYKF